MWSKLPSFFRQPWVIASSLSVGLTGLFLFKMWLTFGTHLPSREDGVLISYLITWVATAISEGLNPYQAPFFQPYSNTLTFSDPFLSTGLLTWPWLLLTQNMVIIHNLHLVLSTIFVALGWYWVGWRLYKSNLTASLMLIWGTFGVTHFQYVVHLHTYLIAGLPWCLGGIISWRQTSQFRWLLLAVAAFWYQLLNSPMSATFLTFILIVFLGDTAWRKVIKRFKLKISLILIVTAVIGWLVYWPYVMTAQHFTYTRTIRDTAHFAASLDRFWQPDMIWFAAITGVLLLNWRRHRRAAPATLSLSTISIIIALGSVLMLGPALKLHQQTVKIFDLPIPLPSAVAYYLIPGWQAFRDSSRWMVVLGVGQTLLLGYVLARSTFSGLVKASLVVATTCFLWLYQVPSLQVFPVPVSLPPAYQLLPDNDKVLAEFPVFYWRMMPVAYLENDRLMYQLRHRHPLFNGVSGFTPPEREAELDRQWQEFPSAASIDRLRSAGVELILIHFDLYDQLAEQHFSYQNKLAPTATQLRQMLRQSTLEEAACTSVACLYTIAPK